MIFSKSGYKIHLACYFVYFFMFMIVCISCKSSKNNQKSSDPKVHPEKNLRFAQKQLHHAIETKYDASLGYPRTVQDDSVRWVQAGDWTSGFFPGELWLMYQYTGDKYWKKKAEKWTAGLKSQQYNTGTHDVGFMMYCSYGNGWRLTHNKKYKKILIQSARSLATRFNPKVGAIKSWNSYKKWKYPVIIDNMINLKLLFMATKLSGDSTFYHIAKQHALTTLKHQFRPDGSSYHVVSYDSTNGKVLWRGTAQGYSDSSTWARGESWGLYGFTMAYRFTKDQKFLQQAKKIAHYILTNKNLPDDDVPYWDYNAPDIPNAPRDVSAAAIMSSGFIKLSHYVDPKDSATYIYAAGTILNSLSNSPYRAQKVGDNHGFILRKSVGSKPANVEVSVPLVYSDYYYIQANLRYLRLMKEKKN
jgi:rhamnogalacturonyl hydrolase YesR